MTPDNPQIDAIVQAVLQQLQKLAAASSTVLPGPVVTEKAAAAPPVATLQITERVVTAQAIQGRLKGIRCLQVNAKSIVTPLVRDLLREAGVRLERVTTDNSKAPASTARRLFLAIIEGGDQADRIDASGPNSGASWQRVGTSEQLVSSVREAARQGTTCRGVLVTRQWATQTCELARRANVRVASVDSVLTATQALAQLDPEIIVVNAIGRSTQELEAILKQIANT